jgi:hypothetical protein
VRQVVLDITRLRSALPGFAPTPLADGVAMTWNQLERAQPARR